MALAWILRDETVSSVIIGTTSEKNLLANIEAGQNLKFSDDEVTAIQTILQH